MTALGTGIRGGSEGEEKPISQGLVAGNREGERHLSGKEVQTQPKTVRKKEVQLSIIILENTDSRKRRRLAHDPQPNEEKQRRGG